MQAAVRAERRGIGRENTGLQQYGDARAALHSRLPYQNDAFDNATQFEYTEVGNVTGNAARFLRTGICLDEGVVIKQPRVVS